MRKNIWILHRYSSARRIIQTKDWMYILGVRVSGLMVDCGWLLMKIPTLQHTTHVCKIHNHSQTVHFYIDETIHGTMQVAKDVLKKTCGNWLNCSIITSCPLNGLITLLPNPANLFTLIYTSSYLFNFKNLIDNQHA